MKAYPKVEENKKRTKHQKHHQPSKKIRLEEESETRSEAIDITEAFIVERLTPELAANMVIIAMVSSYLLIQILF